MPRKRSTRFDPKMHCTGRNISFPYCVIIALETLKRKDVSKYVSELVVNDIGQLKIDKIYEKYVSLKTGDSDA